MKFDHSRMVSFDTETYLIQPGLLAPPLVCGSVAAWARPGIAPQGRLLDKESCRRVFAAVIADPTMMIVGANIAFDMLVMAVDAARRGIDLMPVIFQAYEDGRVFDIQVAEALHAIAQGHLGKDPRTGQAICNEQGKATGRYSLHACVDLLLGRSNAKANDEWRLRYGELDGIPIEQWPETARVYPIDDAVNTLECGLVQFGMMARGAAASWRPGEQVPNRNLHDVAAQCYKAFALHLGAAWGVRTDPVATEALAAAAEHLSAAGLGDFVQAGFVRADGSENGAVVKRAVAIAYGATGGCFICAGTGKVSSEKTGKPVNCAACSATGLDLSTAPVPRTDPSVKFPTGQVQTGRDVLVESGDELLMAYGAHQEDDKILSTYVPFLREGANAPICLRPNAVLDTGRVSYNGPIQLLPRMVSSRLSAELKRRGVDVVGVRDCIVPRPGWLFYSNDYTGGELVTFAESCVNRVGFSKMGEALCKGVDVHAGFGATMMGVGYAEFIELLKIKKDKRAKNFRQAAKPANFGFPGGMGAVKLVLQQRKGGPDTEWPDGPSDLGGGRRGYKGLRFCLLVAGKERCGEVKVTSWGKAERPCPPTCRYCIESAEEMRATWFRQWPEAKPYLDWHAENVDRSGEVVQHYSGRIRGGLEFCAEANGDFQALLADIAGRAQCRVSREQYVDCGTALFGSRSILFAHDELFGEARADIAPEVSERVNEIMVEEFRKGCPHHTAACKAEPTIMPRWWKAAEPRRDASGRLVPWTP